MLSCKLGHVCTWAAQGIPQIWGVMRSKVKVTEVIEFIKMHFSCDNSRVVQHINFKPWACMHMGITMVYATFEVMRSKDKGHKCH